MHVSGAVRVLQRARGIALRDPLDDPSILALTRTFLRIRRVALRAQAASGKMKPEESVKWAAGELAKIYK